jgi:hypothetical protein
VTDSARPPASLTPEPGRWDYPVLREVSIFSWVGVRHHGRGIGTEMRAAALHLAFACLSATDAVSGAFADNVSGAPSPALIRTLDGRSPLRRAT